MTPRPGSWVTLACVPCSSARQARSALPVRTSSGEILIVEPFAPLDQEHGEVLLACQRHFERFPSVVLFEVRVIDADGGYATAPTQCLTSGKAPWRLARRPFTTTARNTSGSRSPRNPRA